MVTELAALIEPIPRDIPIPNAAGPPLLIRVPAIRPSRAPLSLPRSAQPRRRLRREVRQAARICAGLLGAVSLAWMLDVRLATGGDFEGGWGPSPGGARPVMVSLSPELEADVATVPPDECARAVALSGYVVPDEEPRHAGP